VTESVSSHLTLTSYKAIIIEKDLSPFYIHNRV
jgi:hypothetical protein